MVSSCLHQLAEDLLSPAEEMFQKISRDSKLYQLKAKPNLPSKNMIEILIHPSSLKCNLLISLHKGI